MKKTSDGTMGKTTARERVKKYSNVTERLGAILARLYNGETLSKKALAEEYGETLRTIQRDVNERLREAPIEHIGDRFRLRGMEAKERLFSKEELATLELVDELIKEQGSAFYAKAHPLLQKIRNFGAPNAFYVHMNMENVDDKLKELSKLHEAVRKHRVVHCRYRMKKGTYDIDIKPLKIVTFEGFWYVVAMDARNDVVKKYLLRNVSDVRLDEETFERDDSLEEELKKASHIWFEAGEEPFEVRLYIDGEVAHYFETRPIHPTQTIEGKDPGSGIEVVVKITHEMEIIPFIKQWLPHVLVMAPEWIDEMIKEDCEAYLDNE